VKCVQISCPMWSRILWLCACRISTEDNKEKKSWWVLPQAGGEPCISYIVVSLCIMISLCIVVVLLLIWLMLSIIICA